MVLRTRLSTDLCSDRIGGKGVVLVPPQLPDTIDFAFLAPDQQRYMQGETDNIVVHGLKSHDTLLSSLPEPNITWGCHPK